VEEKIALVELLSPAKLQFLVSLGKYLEEIKHLLLNFHLKNAKLDLLGVFLVMLSIAPTHHPCHLLTKWMFTFHKS